MAIPLVAAHAQAPQPPTEHPRPSAEQRGAYEERMKAIKPAKPGCYQAHYPDEHWVETECLPPPRTPNPQHVGAGPNTVGAGTDWFANVTSGHISQVTGSFDNVMGDVQIEGPIGGNTSVVYPNVYAIQMNSNTYTATLCGSLKNCAWVQFIFSQTQCGLTASLSNPPLRLHRILAAPAVPLSDLAGLRVIGETKAGGNDTVIVSDASGTLSMASNFSMLDLATGWTGVEYNLVGDCCSTETFFTPTPLTPNLTLRVAPVNGTTNAPKCLPTFAGGSLVGSTAESNNLTLNGDCTPVSGANPAIVYSEAGGGPLPIGVSVGDTHLTTVNGLHYDFQASGDFVLAETGPDFIVQNQQASGAPTWPNAAVNKAVATKMGTTSVTICVAPTRLFVDGISTTIADGMSRALRDGVTLSRSGNVYFIQNDNGDSVRAQLNHNAQPLNDWIDVSVGLRNASEAPTVRGLLGNPDGNANEIALVDGVVLKEPVSFGVLYQPYGASWRVPFGQSLLCGGQEVEYGIPAAPFYANDLNQQQSERARQICTTAGVNEPSALEDCTLDVTVLGAASAADAFVDAPPPLPFGRHTDGGPQLRTLTPSLQRTTQNVAIAAAVDHLRRLSSRKCGSRRPAFRIARVVVPDLPHHVTQRGNRREPVFFETDDYRLYRRLVAAAARRADAAVWAYCQMPNHVHLIVTPADADGLRATFAEAHRRYTGAINALFRWTGHLFQGRFGAVVMDEPHLLAAARYIALNPVVAGLVSRAEDWPWSSTRAQLAGENDELTTVAPLRALVPDFAALLAVPPDAATTTRIERAPTIGRPLGRPEWIAMLERRLGRPLAPHKPGPKPRMERDTERQAQLL